jgi:choice-of-anchor B domain-containing protein
MRSGILSALTALAGVAIVLSVSAAQRSDDGLTSLMRAQLAARSGHSHVPLTPQHAAPCVDGMADGYPCSNIDLLAFVPKSDFGSGLTNSLWGWVDPDNGDEYALIGADDGVVFYRLNPDPTHPVYVGKLLTFAGDSLWRDVRVYQNYAYVGSDNNPGHGLQIFDLTRLRGLTTPQDFPAAGDGHYNGFGSSHTLSVNVDTGYLGVAGGDHFCPGDSEDGGLQLLDLSNPTNPTLAACVNTDGYTHEAQCFVYHGPDTAYDGHDICFNSDGWSGHLAIVDANDKNALQSLSITSYVGSSFTHQGWLSDDHRYFLVNDELDEEDHGHDARTYVFDVSDLDSPVLVGFHQHDLSVIDHNLYVHGQYVFESNYEAGLRILRIDNLSAAELTEVAFFDLYPGSNTKNFNGNWNNYLFPSGNVIATSIDEGFFVLQPHLCQAPETPNNLVASANGDNEIDLTWDPSAAGGTTYRVERAQSGCLGTFRTIADQLAEATYSDAGVSGQVTYGYRVTAFDGSGFCASTASACVEAETTGACTAAPLFSGIASAVNAGTSQCRIDLGWNAADAACGGPATYSIYRSDASDFVPGDDNRIALGWLDTSYSDTTASGGTTHYYAVHALDGANGAEDDNLVRLAVVPSGPPGDGTFATGAEPGDPLLDTSGTAGEDEDLRRPDEVEHAGWHISSERFHTGTQSFWSIAANNLCITLTTPSLDLTAGETSSLSFWTAWDIEQGWDAGVIQISTDNGANWSGLTPTGGYPGTITDGGTLCGLDEGDGAFTGMGHFTWSAYDVDLSAYAGQSVQVRWVYRTDQAQTGEGWYIDDIALTHAQVPGMCTIVADAIFIDGFDSP